LEHRQQAEATILYNLADLYMRQERYEEAVEYADRADKIFSAAHDYPGSLMALRLRARAEQKQRKKK
jgi:tetratricopeptide (TPR) repeat protein